MNNKIKNMTRVQLIDLFQKNGLSDYQLKNTDNLLKIFGIKIDNLEGFSSLNKEHQEMFEQFIINFYNMHGIDNKLAIWPVSIYFVMDIETCLELNENELITYSREIIALDKENIPYKNIYNMVYLDSENKKYKNLSKVEMKPKEYIRFTYEYRYYDGDIKKEWLHVISPNEWW